jgi:hypothetical protein
MRVLLLRSLSPVALRKAIWINWFPFGANLSTLINQRAFLASKEAGQEEYKPTTIIKKERQGFPPSLFCLNETIDYDSAKTVLSQ